MRALTLNMLLLFATLAGSTAGAAEVANRSTLTLEGAKSIAGAALRYAQDHGAPGAAIAVVDSGGVLLYVERVDGTFQNAANISIGKARTAVLFGKPTRVFEDLVNKGRYTMLALPDIAPFTPLMGGVPIEIDGQVAGAVGVSGAASAAQVIPRAEVDSGFFKDAKLLTGDGFRVEASHRVGPGEAEVHVHDTDIFYVLKGGADLIVGGKVSNPRQLSEGELRGPAIEGGEMRRIASGDVVVIPRGVPHWFKRVNTPFTYYVVKSTTP
jgi:glc operon protein GlcG